MHNATMIYIQCTWFFVHKNLKIVNDTYKLQHVATEAKDSILIKMMSEAKPNVYKMKAIKLNTLKKLVEYAGNLTFEISNNSKSHYTNVYTCISKIKPCMYDIAINN